MSAVLMEKFDLHLRWMYVDYYCITVLYKQEKERTVRPRMYQQLTHVAFRCPASAAFFHKAKAAALSWGTCLPCVDTGGKSMSLATDRGTFYLRSAGATGLCLACGGEN